MDDSEIDIDSTPTIDMSADDEDPTPAVASAELPAVLQSCVACRCDREPAPASFGVCAAAAIMTATGAITLCAVHRECFEMAVDTFAIAAN